MISAKPGIRPEEVRLRVEHTLYVEGSDSNSVDPKALDVLFGGKLRIRPLGAAYSIKSVAQALYQHHPNYYFLIDRDHYDDDFVESCWEGFPNPETQNLLVWRRREIENYFLDPEYLAISNFCSQPEDHLRNKILQFANQRVFLDAANHVIISIREELKNSWIEKFSDISDFSTADRALLKLKEVKEFDKHSADVCHKVSFPEIERHFIDVLREMTGGQDEITFGAGKWIHLIQGKKVLNQIIHSELFRVGKSGGGTLLGREKMNAIVKDLLQKDSANMPPDFIALKGLIESRISASS